MQISKKKKLRLKMYACEVSGVMSCERVLEAAKKGGRLYEVATLQARDTLQMDPPQEQVKLKSAKDRQR